MRSTYTLPTSVLSGPEKTKFGLKVETLEGKRVLTPVVPQYICFGTFVLKVFAEKSENYLYQKYFMSRTVYQSRVIYKQFTYYIWALRSPSN